MKKIILLICIQTLFIFVLSGCTFHIKYYKEDPEPKMVSDTVPVIKTKRDVCIYFSKKEYIDLDVRQALTNTDLAFDYGDAIKKIGEKYFFEYKNIKFLDIDNRATDDLKCDFEVFPKIKEAIYTHPYPKHYRELDVTMNFQVLDKTRNLAFEQTYKSETMMIPWSMTSKYVDLADIFTNWMRNQIIIVINELGSTKGELHHENK